MPGFTQHPFRLRLRVALSTAAINRRAERSYSADSNSFSALYLRLEAVHWAARCRATRTKALADALVNLKGWRMQRRQAACGQPVDNLPHARK